MSKRFTKITIVGDSKVGKTALMSSYKNNRFPKSSDSYFSEEYRAKRFVNGKPYVIYLNILLMDQLYWRVRSSIYKDQDVYLLCFSVDSQESLSNVTAIWLSDLRTYAPGIPIILVALKTDLRTGADGEHCIPFEKGYNIAKQNNMYYMETSSLMVEGLKDLMDNAIVIGANATRSRKETEGDSRSGKGANATRSFKERERDARSGKNKPGPIPPIMPLPVKTPLIGIKTSVFGDQMASALQDPRAADVVFLVEGVNKVKAHRVVLCSACDYFCQVFGIAVPVEKDAIKMPLEFTWPDINDGKVAGLSSIAEIEDDDGHQVIHITVSEDISFVIFSHVLEFLYTGHPKLEVIVDKSVMEELKRVSNTFYLSHLKEIVYNVEYKDECLNPSIETYLNDRLGQRTKELFLGKDTFSDVKFNIQGTIVPAHMVMLMYRSDVMARMFSGLFTETSQGEIAIQDDQEGFLYLLEYLYTDHTPIKECNSIGILTIADKYCEDRLRNLCELYIAEEIDRTVRDCIAKTKLDVIGILHQTQLHNADQLAKWCLHFISTNYQAFTKRPEFNQLDGNNKDYVTENRWPPVTYLEQMKEFEALTETKKKENCEVM